MKPTDLRLLGTRLLAVKYERPDTIHGIVVPENFRQDNSRALWEPVAFSAGALKWFAENLNFADELEAVRSLECVLVTAPHSGVHLPMIEGKEHYLLTAEQVVKVIPFTETEGKANGSDTSA